MAARGSIAKESIMNKIFEVFPNAFIYEKNIIIPMEENGEEVQIKVALTCSKTNVNGGNVISAAPASDDTIPASSIPTVAEVTKEEKDNVVKALVSLGVTADYNNYG